MARTANSPHRPPPAERRYQGTDGPVPALSQCRRNALVSSRPLSVSPAQRSAAMSVAERPDEKLAVIGAGRVGALTAVGLAHLGHDVVATDVSAPRLAALARGYLAEEEAGLRSALTASLRFRRIRFASSLEPGQFSTAFLCVDTPPLPSGEPDLTQILSATRSAASALARNGILVTRSTVPVGTGERLAGVL